MQPCDTEMVVWAHCYANASVCASKNDNQVLHYLIADAAAVIVAYGTLCFPRNGAIGVGKEEGLG